MGSFLTVSLCLETSSAARPSVSLLPSHFFSFQVSVQLRKLNLMFFMSNFTLFNAPFHCTLSLFTIIPPYCSSMLVVFLLQAIVSKTSTVWILISVLYMHPSGCPAAWQNVAMTPWTVLMQSSRQNERACSLEAMGPQTVSVASCERPGNRTSRPRYCVLVSTESFHLTWSTNHSCFSKTGCPFFSTLEICLGVRQWARRH